MTSTAISVPAATPDPATVTAPAATPADLGRALRLRNVRLAVIVSAGTVVGAYLVLVQSLAVSGP